MLASVNQELVVPKYPGIYQVLPQMISRMKWALVVSTTLEIPHLWSGRNNQKTVIIKAQTNNTQTVIQVHVNSKGYQIN